MIITVYNYIKNLKSKDDKNDNKNTTKTDWKSHDIAREMVLNKNSICIQPNHVQADYFSRRWGISRDRVFSFRQFSHPDGKSRKITDEDTKIYIDELGICLDILFSHEKGQIIYCTHTN